MEQKIIKIRTENFKRIEMFELYPNENTNIIAGKNGEGKSSVLDSITWGIGGKKSIENTPEPIRQGAEKAEINIELDNLIIRRVITPSGDRVEVIGRDGTKFSSPQKVLDELYSSISFDPLKFKDMDSKKQVRVLFDAISPDIKYDDLEIQKKQFADERTDINRELKRLKAAIEKLPEFNETDLQMNYVSGTELIGKISSLSESLRLKDEAEKKYKSAVDEYKQIQNQILQLQEKAEQIKESGKKHKEEYEKISLPEDVNAEMQHLKTDLGNIEQLQLKYNKVQEFKELHKDITEKSKSYDKLSVSIQEIEDKKINILKSALENKTVPIKGLSFNDETLMVNNIPYVQLSTSEKLKIAFVISCVINPQLKVILIRDGSLMDSDNLEMLKKVAKHFGVQVWIEMVDDTGKVGVIIEDGKIKEIKEVK
jgi:DNA repair exonuclease SbcCD ATPase subunit